MSVVRRGLAAAVLVAGLSAASAASATLYVINFPTIAPSALTCQTFGARQLCTEQAIFSPFLNVKAGDEFDLHVHLTGPVIVPASGSQSYVFAAFFDTKTTPAGAVGVDGALSTLTMSGYSGPAGSFAGPLSLFRDSYLALGGFAGPHGAFSFTGFDAVITALNDDPNPVLGFSFGTSEAAVPEPAAWGLMITGFGLAGAALRRRRALGV